MSELDKSFGCGNTQSEHLTAQGGIAVEIYHSFEAFADAQPEWDSFMASVSSEIFLTYDWCRIWWKYYGHKRNLAIFIFRHGGKICGLLPLFREKIWIGPLSIAVIKMVSSDFMPVALTVPIKKEYIDQVVGILVAKINAQWRWNLLYIGAICGRYDSLDILVASLKKVLDDEYSCELKTADVQTYFTVAPSWDAQITTLASKQRTNVRRTFRETDNKNIKITNSLASKETLSQMFDNFVQLHQKHWRAIGMAGHFGAWPFAKEFHREIAETQLAFNRLRLIEIKFNDTPVVYDYIYRFGDTYLWFLNARSDFENNSRLDYKWVALRAKIENALKDNVRMIDAMRGTQDYKQLMGGKILPIRHLFVYPTKFPAMQGVFIFRQLAKVMNILYEKMWRRRLAPRLGIKPKTFWENWIRFGHLSS